MFDWTDEKTARWSFGSFYLWGDVPALMPPTLKGVKGKPYETGSSFDGTGRSFQSASVDGLKGAGPKWDPVTKSGAHGMKRWTNPAEGTKGAGGTWFGQYNPTQAVRNTSSGSKARKAASAMIAKIPLPLSRHIAATFRVLA